MPSLSFKTHYLKYAKFSLGLLLTIPSNIQAQASIDYFACSGNVCWTNTSGDNTWANPDNWSTDVVPSGNIAEFTNSPAGSAISIISTQPSITEMLFDTSNSAGFTFNIGSSSTNVGSLTLTGVGIVDNSGFRQTFNINTGSSFTLSGSATLADVAVTTSAASGSVAAGSLFFQNTASGGTATVTNNGIIDISATTSSVGIGNIIGSGNIFLGDSTLSISAASGTYNGIIADGGASGGTGGSLIINTGGTYILDGINTYTGTTTLSTGTLQIGDSSHTGAAASIVSNVILNAANPDGLTVYGTVSGAITSNSSAINIESGGIVSGNINSIGTSTTGSIINLTTNGTVTGNIISNQYGTIIAAGTIDNDTTVSNGVMLIGNNPITSQISISGDEAAILLASGTTDSTENTQIINNSTVPTSGIYGITLELEGGNTVQSIGSISGSGTVGLNGFNLIEGFLNLTDNLTGVISGTGSSVTKIGTGTLILGGVNTYTGTTTVSAGTLQVNSNIGTGTLTNDATTIFNTSTTVNTTITNNGNLTFQSNGNLGSSTITNSDGSNLYITGTSDAGTAMINNNTGANTFFQGSSVGDNATVNNGTGANLYFQGSSDAGSMTVTNAIGGTVYFQGNSEADNITIANAGKLDISGHTSSPVEINNYSGNGSIYLGASTLAAGNSSGALTINGVISGTGSVETPSASGLSYALILNGANTYTGSTIASSGSTLFIGTSTLTSAAVVGPIIVEAAIPALSIPAGTLNIFGLIGNSLINNGVTLVYSSTGSATVVNTDSLTYTNFSTAGSSNIINAGTGTILFNDSSSMGTATITNNGYLDFTDASTGGTAASVINNGLLDLTGLSSSSFVLGSLGGTGNVSLGGATLTTGALNTSTTISGVISGSGGLIKQGTGTLVLDGDNAYTGNTQLQAGALQVGDFNNPGATILGTTTVYSGTTLSGYGTVGNLINNGTLIPGGGPNTPAGTFNIAGNYTQASNAKFISYVDSNGNISNVAATGSAILNGGILEVETFNSPAAIDHLYTILTAPGGIMGTFTPVSTTPFYTQEVFYLPTGAPTTVEYILLYNTPAITGAATTPNELAVANNIIATHASTAINTAIDGLLTADQLSGFLNQLSGATYANQQVMLAQLDREFENQLARRIDAYQACVTQNVRYYKKKKKNSYECNDQLLWFDLYGGNDQIKSSAGISGLNTNNFGLNLGGETPMANNTTIIGGGAGFIDYRGDARGYESASYNGDLYQFGIYLRQQLWRNFRLGGALGYTIVNDNTTTRSIDNVIGGGEMISGYNTGLFNAQGRASYRFVFSDGINLQPLFGVIYQRVNAYSFEEFGLPGFELQVTEKAYNSFRTQLGAEMDFSVAAYNLAPFIYLAWEHEFRDQNGSFQGTFVGLETPFEIVGAPIGKETLVVQGGLAHVQRSYWEFGLSFEGRFSSGFSEVLTVAQLAYF